MEESFVPFRGIKNDLQGRFKCYKEDWTGGFAAGLRYVFEHQLCTAHGNFLTLLNFYHQYYILVA